MSTIIFELSDTAVGWCAALLLAAGWVFVFGYGRKDAKNEAASRERRNDPFNPSNRSN